MVRSHVKCSYHNTKIKRQKETYRGDGYVYCGNGFIDWLIVVMVS